MEFHKTQSKKSINYPQNFQLANTFTHEYTVSYYLNMRKYLHFQLLLTFHILFKKKVCSSIGTLRDNWYEL